jgi:cysteinyl-tRNA synthetase
VAGRLLGLFSDTPDDWFDQAPDPEIEALLVDRKAARESNDWAKADAIRDQLTANNIEVQDNPDGSSSWRRIL